MARINGFLTAGDVINSLRQRFPDSFGGVSSDAKDNLTVLVVDGADQQAIEDYVVRNVASSPENVLPEIRYESVPRSLRWLEQLRDRVMAEAQQWIERGVPIQGAGLDPSTNSVDVNITEPAPGAQDQLAEAYDTAAIKVTVAEYQLLHSCATGCRPHDNPAWNAGNNLVRASNPAEAKCTSGFGLHNATNDFVTSAGHCGSATGIDGWYNTHFKGSDFSVANRVGTTQVNTFDSGTIDAQRIPASSSILFWKNEATRKNVAGWQQPVVGRGICSEGAVPPYEQCGTVSSVDRAALYNGKRIEGLFIVDGAACQPGDSGAPMIWSTGFGYIASGSVTAGNGLNCIGTQIAQFQFALGASVNTVNDP